MERFRRVFGENKPVIAMIHVSPLPGTPRYRGNGVEPLVEKALTEAKIYVDAGVDALMVENMHDAPYLKQDLGPEVTAVMTAVCLEVRRECPLPCGVQILAGGNREAVAAAAASGADFVRAEGFVFSHVADEGFIDACAGELLRYRKAIDAEKVLVFADIKKKHSSHAVTADLDIAATAAAAEYFLADGLVATGSATGIRVDDADLTQVKEAVSIPVLAGSGVTAENAAAILPLCDGIIAGSCFKEGGDWRGPVVPTRVCRFMDQVAALREQS